MVTDHQPLFRLMDQQVLTQVQTRWLRLGLSQSIRPTIKYHHRKANVGADTLSRSQRKEVEDLMHDPIATTVVIEEQVSALSRFSLKLTAEDLTKRTRAMLQHIPSYARDKNMRTFT